MSELYLHIGYAKCATTFLQRQVFPKLKLNYLGRHSVINVRPWVDQLTFHDEVDIDNVAAQIKNVATHEKNLISDEVFLRPYKCERFLSRLYELKKHFGKISIILSIRNQSDLVLSRYVHDYIRFGHDIYDALDFAGTTECSYPYCNLHGCVCRASKVKFINIPFYNYLLMYQRISKLFDVHFIIFENLYDEIKRLEGVMNINACPEDWSKLPHMNIHKHDMFYQKVRKQFRSSNEYKQMMNYFASDNKKLDNMINLDLKKYGYY